MKEGGKPFFSLGINHIQAITYPTPLEIFYKKYDGKWTDAALDIKKNLLKWDFNTAGYGTPKGVEKNHALHDALSNLYKIQLI